MSEPVKLNIYQRRLVGHGGLVLLWGCLVGFPFVFFLIGEVKLWPIPGSLDVQLPGTYDGWRMAHLEGILNGFALWIAAFVLPLIPVPPRRASQLSWAFIVVAWTFVIASLMDPLFEGSRGLHFGGPVTNTIAFLLFYVGVLLITGIAGYIAWACLKPQK